MGSGWANPRAPWLRGHPSLRITALSKLGLCLNNLTRGTFSILSHGHPRAPWHKVTPLRLSLHLGHSEDSLIVFHETIEMMKPCTIPEASNIRLSEVYFVNKTSISKDSLTQLLHQYQSSAAQPRRGDSHTFLNNHFMVLILNMSSQ